MGTYNEFCCRAGGSNLNSGTRNGGSTEPGLDPDFEYVNGSWDAATNIFTVASGDPQSDGVQVGDFVSIYTEGATNTGFISVVSAVDSTTITVAASTRLGTEPTTGTRSLRIGGAWLGCNGAGFPVSLNVYNFYVNDRFLRFNFKNDRVHVVTSTASLLNNCCGEDFVSTRQAAKFEGYRDTYGDGGMTLIKGNSSGASYVLWNIQRGKQVIKNLWFDSNGSTGSSELVYFNTAQAASIGGIVENCLFTNAMGEGLRVDNFNSGNPPAYIIGCIFYNNNKAGTKYGMSISGIASVCRCISKDNGIGFINTGGDLRDTQTNYINCISVNNAVGFGKTAGEASTYINCVSYNDTIGFNIGADARLAYTENCLAVNSTTGIAHTSSTSKGFVHHRKFTTYNVTNRFTYSGTSADDVRDEDGITLSSDPFRDAANGDFRLNNISGGGSELFGSAYDSYLQETEGALGTVSLKDIGAVESAFINKRYILNRR